MGPGSRRSVRIGEKASPQLPESGSESLSRPDAAGGGNARGRSEFASGAPRTGRMQPPNDLRAEAPRMSNLPGKPFEQFLQIPIEHQVSLGARAANVVEHMEGSRYTELPASGRNNLRQFSGPLRPRRPDCSDGECRVGFRVLPPGAAPLPTARACAPGWWGDSSRAGVDQRHARTRPLATANCARRGSRNTAC